ncbi:hypothetical protein J7F01_37095 [Streptomyces sp. ISL-22]|uniref:Uncharacterized protein n=2 Tax=Streptomyces curacoi TaxID=146536 RepID=A0A124GU45_9ACTN|nr:MULTISPECIES: hypothetical protein [unclassified Streptomyces]KUM67410.1 hypothetical protein AQI70_36270 [Streptomyces curacoi]MBT2419051.1 hypothetical protein [Streptomyces sp. ISL-24]MBT2437664.1 hypothetical protein [Streptomyces sp. ISL-22]
MMMIQNLRRVPICVGVVACAVVSVLGMGATAALADGRTPAPLVSLKNLQQGQSSNQLSPDSVQERKFINEGVGAHLLNAENVRQGIPLVGLSPRNVNRDVFINHG